MENDGSVVFDENYQKMQETFQRLITISKEREAKIIKLSTITSDQFSDLVKDKIVSLTKENKAPWQQESYYTTIAPIKPEKEKFKGFDFYWLCANAREVSTKDGIKVHDPRWCNFYEAQDYGYRVQYGEHGTFLSRIRRNQEGEYYQRFENLFNFSQLNGIPKLDTSLFVRTDICTDLYKPLSKSPIEKLKSQLITFTQNVFEERNEISEYNKKDNEEIVNLLEKSKSGLFFHIANDAFKEYRLLYAQKIESLSNEGFNIENKYIKHPHNIRAGSKRKAQPMEL